MFVCVGLFVLRVLGSCRHRSGLRGTSIPHFVPPRPHDWDTLIKRRMSIAYLCILSDTLLSIRGRCHAGVERLRAGRAQAHVSARQHAGAAQPAGRAERRGLQPPHDRAPAGQHARRHGPRCASSPLLSTRGAKTGSSNLASRGFHVVQWSDYLFQCVYMQARLGSRACLFLGCLSPSPPAPLPE